MKRADFIAQLEQRRLRVAAREYAQQGYRVTRHPSRTERPDFLAEFEPDLIAYSAHENVVVEVRSRETLEGADDLVALTIAVNAQPGWRIDLIVTNPREQPIVQKNTPLLADDEIQERIMVARQLLVLEQVEGAFVLAWSAIENFLRQFGETGTLPVDYLGAQTLLGDTYGLGLLSRQDYETLREALHQRNAIVYGYRTSTNLGSIASKIIDIAEGLQTIDVAALAS